MTRVGEYVAHPNNGNGVWRSEILKLKKIVRQELLEKMSFSLEKTNLGIEK